MVFQGSQLQYESFLKIIISVSLNLTLAIVHSNPLKVTSYERLCYNKWSERLCIGHSNNTSRIEGTNRFNVYTPYPCTAVCVKTMFIKYFCPVPKLFNIHEIEDVLHVQHLLLRKVAFQKCRLNHFRWCFDCSYKYCSTYTFDLP